jgi:hypothetical protein
MSSIDQLLIERQNIQLTILERQPSIHDDGVYILLYWSLIKDEQDEVDGPAQYS